MWRIVKEALALCCILAVITAMIWAFFGAVCGRESLKNLTITEDIYMEYLEEDLR